MCVDALPSICQSKPGTWRLHHQSGSFLIAYRNMISKMLPSLTCINTCMTALSSEFMTHCTTTGKASLRKASGRGTGLHLMVVHITSKAAYHEKDVSGKRALRSVLFLSRNLIIKNLQTGRASLFNLDHSSMHLLVFLILTNQSFRYKHNVVFISKFFCCKSVVQTSDPIKYAHVNVFSWQEFEL